MSANEQKADGMMDQAKGKVKQAWGDLTDNESLKAEGHADETKGDVKEGVANVRKDISDAID